MFSTSLTTFYAGQTTPVVIRAILNSAPEEISSLRRVCAREADAGARGVWNHTHEDQMRTLRMFHLKKILANELWRGGGGEEWKT